jgi:hypothetical protein
MFRTYIISSSVNEGSHPIWSPQESFFLVQGVCSQWSFPADYVSNEKPFYLLCCVPNACLHEGGGGEGYGNWEHNEPKKRLQLINKLGNFWILFPSMNSLFFSPNFMEIYPTFSISQILFKNPCPFFFMQLPCALHV